MSDIIKLPDSDFKDLLKEIEIVHNPKFSKEPQVSVDTHRQLAEAYNRLADYKEALERFIVYHSVQDLMGPEDIKFWNALFEKHNPDNYFDGDESNDESTLD